MRQTKVQRNYRDTIFRMVFREKENLLKLYNALNGTNYTDEESLEITTLENAVYMNYKNDISFVFDFQLMLYEHQSTFNPNMPLRDLFYAARVLEAQIKDQNLYGSVLIKIPAPRFVVFYNGTDFQPEQQTLRLSDAFVRKQESPELELIMTVYNINWGSNRELMEACRLLKEYARYVEQVRVFAREMAFPEAVELAVDYCIRNGILEDFLSRNRAEAIAMSIFEYNEEQYMKSEREQAYKNGRDEGIEEGRKEGLREGEMRFAQLLEILADEERDDDVRRAISDQTYREKLYQEKDL